MRKLIAILFWSFLSFFSGIIFAQGKDCPDFKIGVILEEIYLGDTTINFLNEKHEKNMSSDAWVSEIESRILAELNSAGYNDLEFYSLRANPGMEMDFKLSFYLSAWSIDGELLIPSMKFEYVDPVTGWEITEYTDPVYSPENAFRMTSRLSNYSPCIPGMAYILSIEFSVETDIYQCTKNLIHHHLWPLDRLIWRWESDHIVPARKPEMEIRYEKDYLSILDEDSRKMEVYAKVKNCRGEYVYNKFHSQPVYFLKETDRLDSKSSKKCLDGPPVRLFVTIFTNPGYEAINEYSVKRGTEASIEKIQYKTCGLGQGSIVESEGEIKVRGLELGVEPDRKTICNGEKTTIQIDMHEVDPDGTEDLSSCEGREVEVKVTGLIDGSVSHQSGMMTLNEAGTAFIDYKAGQHDKQILISASFTPPGYPETVRANATVNVKPLDYDATLTIKGRFTNTERSSYSTETSSGIEKGNMDLQEISEASFYVPLKLVDAGDMPMLNQRWEYYQPLDINLSSFNASYRLHMYDYANYKGYGFEKTTVRTKTPMNRKVAGKEYLLKSNIILIINKKTNKVVKIATGGFPVEFFWDEKENITGRHWNPDGEEPINISNHKRDDSTSQYDASPVEDEVADPTFPGVEEAMRQYFKDLGTPLPADIDIPADESQKAEVQPDLLVDFGDGITYFGGNGRKIIDNSEGSNTRRKEMTFSWQVARKKK